jgi:hypothetical protein
MKAGDEARAGAIINAGLSEFGWTDADLEESKKSDWRKAILAYLVRRDTTMSLDWISAQLRMRTRSGVSRSATEAGKELEGSRKLRAIVRRIKKATIND